MFFVKFNLLALRMLHITLSAMWIMFSAYANGLCLEILSEAPVMPGKLHIAAHHATLILQARFPYGVSCKYWP